MIEVILLPVLAKIRRELSRLIFLGLLCTYGLTAWAVCGAGGCDSGFHPALLLALERAQGHLWHGMAVAYLLEFTGGLATMTIGLAWDWWRQRPAKAAEKAAATAQAEAQAALREKELELLAKDLEYRTRVVSAQEQALAFRTMLVNNGINPDTGERMPDVNNGNGAAGK